MSCIHNWVRLEVAKISVHGNPMEPVTAALFPVKLCTDCYEAHISFGHLHLTGVLRHEQTHSKL